MYIYHTHAPARQRRQPQNNEQVEYSNPAVSVHVRPVVAGLVGQVGVVVAVDRWPGVARRGVAAVVVKVRKQLKLLPKQCTQEWNEARVTTSERANERTSEQAN